MRIRDFRATDAPAVMRIYEDSFPPEERRPYASPEAMAAFMAAPERDMDALVAVDREGGVAGFLTYWRFPAFHYVEHLAVRREARGAGTGAALVKALAARCGGRILLEVERPELMDSEEEADTARRRIGFYRRLGLRPHPEVRYVQPPYAPGLPGVELMLMTSGLTGAPEKGDVERLIREVYGSTGAVPPRQA